MTNSANSSEPPDLFAAAPLPVAPLDDAQRLACLRLIRSENVGPATFRALINHYGGAQAAIDALPELSRRAGRGRAVRICTKAAAEAELEAAAHVGAHILFTIEPGYPAPLAFLEGAPPMLYAKGRLELLNRQIIAIVGSRQSSAAGQQLARQFSGAFGSAGYVVASGLARGIDGASHQAALATGTIAVVAGGVDIVYPPEHKALQADIAVRGCVIAEQPLGFQPRAQDFPRRNRIISGLARAVVIVEAARRSGSLITARLAAEQGREVFAVPGHPLDPRAEGTNQLLKDGAQMATTPQDVLAVLNEQAADHDALRRNLGRNALTDTAGSPGRSTGSMEEPAASAPSHLPIHAPGHSPSMAEMSVATTLEQVTAVLGPAPVGIDEIARSTGLPVRTVQVAVMELVLAGRLEMHGRQLVSLRLPD